MNDFNRPTEPIVGVFFVAAVVIIRTFSAFPFCIQIVKSLQNIISANGFATYWLQSISLAYARAQAESIMVWVGHNAPLCADSDANTPV